MTKLKSNVKSHFKSEHGFSLTEVMLALGCMTFIALAVGTLSTFMISSETQTIGRQNAIALSNEIRDLLLKAPKSGTSAECAGLIDGNTFNPAQPTYEIPLTGLGLADKDPNMKLEKLTLQNAVQITVKGLDIVYAAQLVAHQKLVVNGNDNKLRSSVLGILNITVNNSGQIVACNWDEDASSAANTCAATPGMVATLDPEHPCVAEGSAPTLDACPTDTALDSTVGRCIPANIDCYARALGKNFDGSSLNCNFLPPVYVVRYPAGYTPPAAPVDPSGSSPGGSGGASPSPSPSPSATPKAEPTPALKCTCGPDQLDPGDPRKCVKMIYRDDEGAGNYDDYFEVKICNSRGVLENDNPSGYKEEEGDGNFWGPRIGTCYPSGSKTSTYKGRTFKRGSCQ